MSKGHLIADVVANLGTLDIVLGDVIAEHGQPRVIENL